MSRSAGAQTQLSPPHRSTMWRGRENDAREEDGGEDTRKLIAPRRCRLLLIATMQRGDMFALSAMSAIG